MADPSSMTANHARLTSHFENRSIEQQGDGWSELWNSGENTLWDRGLPSPALNDLLTSERDMLSPVDKSNGVERRKKALVAGCGKGYDPVMLALHGFEAWGIEISETGVETAKRYAEEQMKNPSSNNFSESGDEKSERIEGGSVQILLADFFARDWERKIASGNAGGGGAFDLIYDYTFLCALHPSQRASWAKRMSELLKPGGLLICLEFPLWKELHLPGPPWPLKGVYWDLLGRGGDGLVTTGNEQQKQEKNGEVAQGDFTRERHFRPKRSYEQGRGQDMVSIWRRK